MTTVLLCFRAIKDGGWHNPIRIIEEREFGQIKDIERVYPTEFIYKIILETEDDPEEILDELLRDKTIKILLMTADEHEIFRSKSRNNRSKQKK